MMTFVYIITAVLVGVWVFYMLYFMIDTLFYYCNSRIFCFFGFHKPSNNMRMVDGKWVTNCTTCGKELYMDENNKWRETKDENT